MRLNVSHTPSDSNRGIATLGKWIHAFLAHGTPKELSRVPLEKSALPTHRSSEGV